MVEVGDNVSDVAKQRIIWMGLSKAAEAGPLSAETLLSAMNAELMAMRAMRPERYVMTTSVSLGAPPPTKSLSLLDCDIRFFEGAFPKPFRSREAFDSKWSNASEPSHTPDSYCKVTIACQARLTYDAVDKCMDAIDLARGLMSILENPTMSISLGGRRSPINRIRLGGLHALHHADGSLAEDFYWLHPSFESATPHLIRTGEGSCATKNHRWMFRQFAKLPNRSKKRLKDALLIYVRAFDESDRNTTLIRGWRAVESLLGSGDNCEPVARRCAFLFNEFDYHRQIVDHLRECRNRSAHSGQDLDDATVHCFQLQRYFREVVLFHLRNATVFESIDEANTFLDLPRSPAVLRRRRTLLRKAEKFHSPES